MLTNSLQLHWHLVFSQKTGMFEAQNYKELISLFLLLNLWPIFNTHSLHSCKITLFCWQGFSVEGQENIQEILSKQLYLCQFLCAISILRQGKESLFLIHWTCMAGQFFRVWLIRIYNETALILSYPLWF